MTVEKSEGSINSNRSDQTRALQPADQLRFYLLVDLVQVADDMIGQRIGEAGSGRVITVEGQGGLVI